MNDCYWGGYRDRYYYECDTGRIIGSIDGSESTTYSAYYKETLGNACIGEYIDCDRARKAVETAHKMFLKEQEYWTTYVGLQSVPDEEPKKSWWKIWE